MRVYLNTDETTCLNWQPRRVYVLADRPMQQFRNQIEQLNEDSYITNDGLYEIVVVDIDRQQPYKHVEGMKAEVRQSLAGFDIVAREMPQFRMYYAYQTGNIESHTDWNEIMYEIEEFIISLTVIDNKNEKAFKEWQLRAEQDGEKNPLAVLADDIATAEETDTMVKEMFSPMPHTHTRGNIEVRENVGGGYSVVLISPNGKEIPVTFKNADACVLYVFLLMHPEERIGLKNMPTYRQEIAALTKHLFIKKKNDNQIERIVNDICRPNPGNEGRNRSIIQVQSSANSYVKRLMKDALPDFSDYMIQTIKEEEDTYRLIPLAKTSVIPEGLKKEIKL